MVLPEMLVPAADAGSQVEPLLLAKFYWFTRLLAKRWLGSQLPQLGPRKKGPIAFWGYDRKHDQKGETKRSKSAFGK